MREILFRAKSLHFDKWIEGYYAKGDKDCIVSFGDAGIKWQAVKPETVGQFTGLTDKKGTKIFEGDLVHFPDCVNCSCGSGDYEETSSIGAVAYDEESMCFYFSHRYSVEMEDFYIKDGCMTEVEVIGNVFDNPEIAMG